MTNVCFQRIFDRASVFKTGAFNRSAISPLVSVYNHNN